MICYVLNKVDCVRRTDFESEYTESLWLQIIQPGTCPLLLCRPIVYRPPDSLVEWYNQFENELHGACTFSSNVIIMGDFNIDLLNQSNIPDRWKYIYNSYGLTQIIKQPTRVTETNASLLDHIYVTCLDSVKASQVIKMTFSDDYGIGMRWKPGGKCKDNSGHDTITYKKHTSVNPSIASAMGPKL